jgi:hypothetical protein
LAADGSILSIPDTPANEARFGRPKASPGETAYPQLKAITITETSTRQIRAVVFKPYNFSERDAVQEMLDYLVKGDLLLTDRGISAAWLFGECQERSIHFLGRITSSWEPQFIKSLGIGDSLVTVEGAIPKKFRKSMNGKKAKASVKMTLRMIEYKIGQSEKIRLLTDLLSPGEYPAIELVKLYHDRWECEIAYDEIKNHLASKASGTQDLVFRSKSPDGVLQEAYALVGMYNMIRGIMVEAGELNNIDPLEISFVDTVQVIKETTLHFQVAATDQQRSIIYRQLLKDIVECQNPRPRSERQYPRAVKRKKNKYNSRAKDYCQKITKFEAEIEMVERKSEPKKG